MGIRVLKVLIVTIIALAVIVGSNPLLAETLTVGAPSSLKAPFTDILPLFE